MGLHSWESESSASSSSCEKWRDEEARKLAQETFVQAVIAIGKVWRTVREDRLQFPERYWPVRGPKRPDDDPKSSSLGSHRQDEQAIPVPVSEAVRPLLEFLDRRITHLEEKRATAEKSQDAGLAYVLIASSVMHNIILEKSSTYSKSVSWEGGMVGSRWKYDIDKLLLLANTVERSCDMLHRYAQCGGEKNSRMQACHACEWFSMGESESVWLAGKLRGYNRGCTSAPYAKIPDLPVFWGGDTQIRYQTKSSSSGFQLRLCCKKATQVAPSENFANIDRSEIHSIERPNHIGTNQGYRSPSDLIVDRPSIVPESLSALLTKELQKESWLSTKSDPNMGKEGSGPLRVRSFRKTRSTSHPDGDPNRLPMAPTDNYDDPGSNHSMEYMEALPLIRAKSSEHCLIEGLRTSDDPLSLYQPRLVAMHLKYQLELILSYQEGMLRRLRSWICQIISQHLFTTLLQLFTKKEPKTNCLYFCLTDESLITDDREHEILKQNDCASSLAECLKVIDHVFNDNTDMNSPCPRASVWCSDCVHSLALRLKPSVFLLFYLEECVAPLLQHSAQLSTTVCGVTAQQCVSSTICALLAFLRDPYMCFRMATTGTATSYNKWEKMFPQLKGGCRISCFGILQLQADLLFLKSWFATGALCRVSEDKKGKREFKIPSTSLECMDILFSYYREHSESIKRFWPMSKLSLDPPKADIAVPDAKEWCTLLPIVGAVAACRSKGFQYAQEILSQIAPKESELPRSATDTIQWLRHRSEEYLPRHDNAKFGSGGLSPCYLLLGTVESWQEVVTHADLRRFNDFINKYVEDGLDLDPYTICLAPNGS